MPAKNWSGYGFAVVCILAGAFLSGCKSEVKSAPAGPVEVAVVTVQSKRVVLTTELPGRINAFLVAEIRQQVSGLLQKRLFKEGTYVKEGQILYQEESTAI
jgi:membrane fusion protein, multidrug efflux system